MRALFLCLLQEGLYDMHTLYQQYFYELAKDLADGYDVTEEPYKEIADLRLRKDLDAQLRAIGSDLSTFGFAAPNLHDELLLEEYLKFPKDDMQRQSAALQATLTDEQRVFVTATLERINTMVYNGRAFHFKGWCAFLNSPAGAGKTHALRAIAAAARSWTVVVLCCASSGLAALSLDGGRTAHSTFHIPVGDDGTVIVITLNPDSAEAVLLKHARLILWDEFPMADKAWIEAVDMYLRRLHHLDEPFGGKIAIGSGDFRQIPPVVPRGSVRDSYAKSILQSDLWQHFDIFQLTRPFRHRNDLNYWAFLQAIGNGTYPAGEKNCVDLPELLQSTRRLEDCIHFVYPGDVLGDPEAVAKRGILTGRNLDVDGINEVVLSLLPGPDIYKIGFDEMPTLSAEYPVDRPYRLLDPDVLHDIDTIHALEDMEGHEPTMAKAGQAPPRRLRLKRGGVFFIERNLNVKQGAMHNVKVVITHIGANVIKARTLGEHSHELLLPRITFRVLLRCGSTLTRRQFPLRPAYAFTYHKAQGQTLDKACLDCRTDFFAHGQLYVGLSRVRNASDMVILTDEDHENEQGRPRVRNIVYKPFIAAISQQF